MKLIVAFCASRGIGFKNALPWRLKADMDRFQKLTTGNKNNAVIMGKNTWNSIPYKYKPLPKRENVVVTRNILKSRSLTRPWIFGSLPLAKDFCTEMKFDDVWMIGGGALYAAALDAGIVESIYATRIYNDYECDVFFPDIPRSFALHDESDLLREGEIRYKFEIWKNTSKHNTTVIE